MIIVLQWIVRCGDNEWFDTQAEQREHWRLWAGVEGHDEESWNG